MRRWITITTFVAALLGCTAMASASVFPPLTMTMDCSVFMANCAFDPGDLGSPEQGLADFGPVAPGWSASFASGPAIAWGSFGGSYQAVFGGGGFFAIAAPDGMLLAGTLTSGVAFTFPGGEAETVAWFKGHWNNGFHADGVMVWNNFDSGAPVILEVNTYTPEPGGFLLFGSGLAGLARMWRRTL